MARQFFAGDFIRIDLTNALNCIGEEFQKITPILSDKKNRIEGIIKDKHAEFSSKETIKLLGSSSLFLVCEIDDENKKSLKTHVIEIKQNIEAEDIRTNNEKMIEIIENVLEGRIRQEYKSYTINNRSIEKYTPQELLSLLKYYKAQVYKDKMNELTPEERARSQLRLINLIHHDFY